MKKNTILVIAMLWGALTMSSCDKKSYCPVEVNVPIVSADIPDTVDAGETFTCDFVLDKGECIKEYGVYGVPRNDTVCFFGRGMQDYCECLDDVPVEASTRMKLGDYDKYLVIYSSIDDERIAIGNIYDTIAVRKK